MRESVDRSSAAPDPVTAESCPVCPESTCDHCVPGATGPADCPMVRIVLGHPALYARLQKVRSDHALLLRCTPKDS